MQPLEQLQLLQYSKQQMAKTFVKAYFAWLNYSSQLLYTVLLDV